MKTGKINQNDRMAIDAVVEEYEKRDVEEEMEEEVEDDGEDGEMAEVVVELE